MNRNYSHKQNTAGLIRYSCGILFMLFSFCYLYFLQGEILAEAQYVYSGGATTYNLFVGALIITAVLQIVQWLVSLASCLPSRYHALSYLPSILMLTIITDMNETTMSNFSLGAWRWLIPLIIFIYMICVWIVKRIPINEEQSDTFKALLYPNYIVLFILILIVGAIPQSTDVYHYEQKTERLILEEDYEAATRVGKKSLRATPRLTQLRMYALSQQGLLPERLFEYPQYYGSKGLLDATDTLSTYRFNTKRICAYLGAYCGKSIHSTSRYYELLFADSLWNQHTVDYYLCSLLLDKKLEEFLQQLPRYYNLSDSIPNAYNQLPKAYREALFLIGNHAEALQGKLVINNDTLATFTDTDMIHSFNAYNDMKAEIADLTERINKTHRSYGKTYWWYYDYSNLAKGELKAFPL